MELYNNGELFTMASTPSSMKALSPQIAVLNIVGTLYSFNKWLETNNTPVDETGWVFSPTTPSPLHEIVSKYLDYTDLIQQLLDKHILRIIVDTKYDIIQQKVNKTNVHSKIYFDLDLDTLQTIHAKSCYPLYSYARLCYLIEWGTKIEKFYKYMNNNTVICIKHNNWTRFGTDKFGYEWFQYRVIGHNNFVVRLTKLPDEFENFYTIVNSHNKKEFEYTHSYEGAVFHPVRLPINNDSISTLLGCENNGKVCVGAQATGVLEISKKYACYLETVSVVAAVTRGGGTLLDTTNTDNYLYLFDSKNKCTILYEIYISNKLVHAQIGTESNIKWH